jgi:HNH endonuclease
MSGSKSTTAPAIRHRIVKEGYRVGDDGSVWSCVIGGCNPRVGDRWVELKPSPQKSGHMRVWLGRDDQRFVHILVLEAFVGPCPEGLECRHLDGNPGNNRLDNLCWGTRKENYDDSVRHGTASLRPGGHLGEENLSSKLAGAVVREVMRLRESTGAGAKTIARGLGLGDGMRGAVDGIIRGQSWNHVTGLPPYQPRRSRRGRRRRAGDLVAPATSDNHPRPAETQVLVASAPPALFSDA